MESTFIPNAVELGLEENSIPPGDTGRVSARIDQILDVLHTDSVNGDLVRAIFIPTWFSPDFTHGDTDLTVTFHFPLDLDGGDVHWHQAPHGWPAEPATSEIDGERITYSWHNPRAFGYLQYLFGASFPRSLIPESAIFLPSQLDPDFAIAYFNRSIPYAEAAQYEQAIIDLDNGIEIDPTNAYAYLLRGVVFGEIGKVENAVADLETALELGLEPEDKQDAEAMLEYLISESN